MLLLFICNYGCTISDKKQQYEIVTTVTTTQSNLHRLLSVQDTMQIYMGKNTDIPPQSDPICTESYYTSDSMTYDIVQYQMDPHINPTCRESYYTRSVCTYWTMQRYIVPVDLPTPSPLNRAQVYRVLLHQDSMTLQNADVPSANWPSHIKPKCTEVYYTRT